MKIRYIARKSDDAIISRGTREIEKDEYYCWCNDVLNISDIETGEFFYEFKNKKSKKRDIEKGDLFISSHRLKMSLKIEKIIMNSFLSGSKNMNDYRAKYKEFVANIETLTTKKKIDSEFDKILKWFKEN